MHRGWLALGVFVVAAVASGSAAASTFRKERRPIDAQGWHGCGEPPAEMKPRPAFACGDRVTDTSTGKPRDRKVTELSASQDKAGGWHWAYLLDDGTAASAATLKGAQ